MGHLIPARYLGPQQFWSEFRQITDAQHSLLERLPAYITSNPRDCLAFGTVGQVLRAAIWTSSRTSYGSPSLGSLDQVLEMFGLSRAVQQPLRTLSGGETVRLSLAKVKLAAARVQRLVIASPFCWLSRHHLPLLDRVLDCYGEHRKPVEMMILQGESRQDEIPADQLQRLAIQPQDFLLEMRGLKIDLGTPINAVTAQQAHARVCDFDKTLTSPCLLVGDNGQGKSLAARALCGAIGCKGTARITSRSGQGRGRLLFQDVVTQTLLRSFDELGRSAVSSGTAPDAARLCSTLLKLQQEVVKDAREADNIVMPLQNRSLLAVKTMLIAVRLARRPAALILDEPDWGLSRDDAIGLVLAVIHKAHQLGVPVILISHKPWWHSLARSVVTVSKSTHRDREAAFDITLTSP